MGAVQLTFNPRERIEGFSESSVCDRGLLFSTLLGFWRLEGINLGLLTFSCLMYLFGVHLPTITVNIPLNNRLQSLDLAATTDFELHEIVGMFESRWLRWNTIRTSVAALTSLMLLVLLLRL